MMNIKLGDKKMKTDGDDFWIAPNATVIGDVILKKDASIWFNAVRTVAQFFIQIPITLLEHYVYETIKF